MKTVKPGLHRLLRPRHIAVFGGWWAENVVEQCLAMPFSGKIWPVNPNRSNMHGIRCLRSAAELPEGPDASFLGVNRSDTPKILRQLASRGSGGAICFASGFAESELEESGGEFRQQELAKAAGDMTLLGPNCYGLVNYLDGVPLWPDQHGGARCDRGVAIVSQSSNMAINMTMQARSLPLAFIATVGNQCQTSLTEVALALLEDERITALGLHIEGFGDLRQFEQLAGRARSLGKPIAALKAGKSQKARAMTVSHTGTVAGSDTFSSALLQRLGIAKLDDIPAFLETLKLLHAGGPLTGRRIGSLSCSGGEACLIADTADGGTLQFPALEPGQEAALRRALGPRVHLANPLDYHTYHWGDREALTEVFSAMLLGSYDLLLLIMDFPRRDRCSDSAWEPAVQAIEAAARKSGKRVALVATLPECLPESWAGRLLGNGVVPMHGATEALAAAEAAAQIGEGWRQPAHRPLVLSEAKPRAREVLNEAVSKALFAELGLTVPEGGTATGSETAVRIAGETGFPIVLKALDIPHKTESGGIAAGLSCADEVAAAFAAMPADRGILVEAQITDAVAELLLGIVRDPSGAFLMTVGSGGVHAELFGDTRSMLLPFDDDVFRKSLGELRCWPQLAGYRGRPAADLDAVVAAARALAAFVESNADRVLEVEVNPFLARPEGGIAADALICRSIPWNGEQ